MVYEKMVHESPTRQEAFDPVHCLPKSNSLNNINCEQDTGKMTNYLLLYFKVHLEGLNKPAQAQVL